MDIENVNIIIDQESITNMVIERMELRKKVEEQEKLISFFRANLKLFVDAYGENFKHGKLNSRNKGDL